MKTKRRSIVAALAAFVAAPFARAKTGEKQALLQGAPPYLDPSEENAINIVFDGPPGPEAGRFVEVELDDGRSISVGEWIERLDGMWALRIAGRVEKANWEETARFHARNEEFWRGLVMRCGELLGEECYTQDDGGKVEEPLGLKVPEVLESRLSAMRGALGIQGGDGNWNCDSYMHGMLNGMEFMMAAIEGREPDFRCPPERFLSDIEGESAPGTEQESR